MENINIIYIIKTGGVNKCLVEEILQMSNYILQYIA